MVARASADSREWTPFTTPGRRVVTSSIRETIAGIARGWFECAPGSDGADWRRFPCRCGRRRQRHGNRRQSAPSLPGAHSNHPLAIPAIVSRIDEVTTRLPGVVNGVHSLESAEARATIPVRRDTHCSGGATLEPLSHARKAVRALLNGK